MGKASPPPLPDCLSRLAVREWGMSHGRPGRRGRQASQTVALSHAFRGLLCKPRAAGTGETAGPWVILAVWSGRVPGTSRPWPSKELGAQACHQGRGWGGVQPASPSCSGAHFHPPTPPRRAERTHAQPGSTKTSSATHKFHPPPPQASLPITCNCGGTCHRLRHLGGSRAGIVISQMRKQTAQQGVHFAGGHSALLQGWPGPPFQTGCTQAPSAHQP